MHMRLNPAATVRPRFVLSHDEYNFDFVSFWHASWPDLEISKVGDTARDVLDWTCPYLSVLGPEEGTCKKKCYIQYNGTLVTKTCISMMDECNATLALLLFSLKMGLIFFMAG